MHGQTTPPRNNKNNNNNLQFFQQFRTLYLRSRMYISMRKKCFIIIYGDFFNARDIICASVYAQLLP